MNLMFDEGEKVELELSKGQQMKEPLLPGPRLRSQKSDTMTLNQEATSKLKKLETKLSEEKVTEKKKSSKKVLFFVYFFCFKFL